MSDFVSVTTSSGRLQHFAYVENLRQVEFGRVGSALCDSQIYTDVYDQVAYDAYRMRWNSAYKQILITSLPKCKRCAKKSGLS